MSSGSRNKYRFIAVVLVAITVSAITSSLVTLYLHPNSQTNSSNSQQTTQQPTISKIFLSHKENLEVPEEAVASYVTVYSNVTIYNLTIVYQYHIINNGSINATELTRTVEYGNYYPAWGVNAIVSAGQTYSSNYEIPKDIISSSSTTYYDPSNTEYFFKIYPQLNVTVYGYS